VRAAALAALGVAASLALSACDDTSAPEAKGGANGRATPGPGDAGPTAPPAPGTYVFDVPPGYPLPLVPADNPMSTAKVELGRMLFYDRRLSANGKVSCATCHQQRHAFADGRGVSVGIDGRPHPLSAPSLANAGYHARYGWASPATETLEAQVRAPLFGEDAPVIEMGLTTAALREAALARLSADDRYRAAVVGAFPGIAGLGFDAIIKALASFERSLISMSSGIERFRRGDANALSPAAGRGAVIFNSDYKGAVCHHCHDGITFSNDVLHASAPFAAIVYTNVGLYNIGGTGDYPPGNQGIFERTGNLADRGKFRTPTLRNVALTAPYMHDGSATTLRDTVEHYQTGGRLVASGPYAGDGRANPNKERGLGGMVLDERDKLDLVAFLESLTDRSFVENPALANPFPADPSFGE